MLYSSSVAWSFRQSWFVLLNYLNLICKIVPLSKTISENKILRRPGIEPGSTAWKAAMLTTIPPTLVDYLNGRYILRQSRSFHGDSPHHSRVITSVFSIRLQDDILVAGRHHRTEEARQPPGSDPPTLQREEGRV